MDKNSKGYAQFLLSLIFTLIAFVGIGYYAYKNGQIRLTPQQRLAPTPTPTLKTTANWKTYRNKKHGFVFKYPQVWVQKQSYGGKGEEWLIIFGIDKGRDNIITSTEPGNVELREFANNQNLSFREAIIDELSNTSPVPFDPEERRQVIINNLNNMEETTIHGHKVLINETSAYIFIEPEVVSLRTLTPSDGVHKILFNQILSTFNFLNQPDVQKNIQWVTYNNSEYGFTFQYPSDMTLEKDTKKEEFYDTIAKLVAADYSINVRAIYNIDIYDDAETQLVAGREISDSGFTYSLTNSIINGLSTTTAVVNNSSKKRIVTIAHPTKNLFIVIASTGGNQPIDSEILSTFKFLDASQSESKLTGYDSPAAGVCTSTPEEIITVTKGVDNIFSPRCSKALPSQKLKIINNSNTTIKIDISMYKIDIEPGNGYEFPDTLGSFLGTGVHSIGGV